MLNKKWLRHPVMICGALGIASFFLVLALQSLAIVQGLELRVFDNFLSQRPTEAIDNRIVIISETEPDIRRYGHPLADQIFADALQKTEQAGALSLIHISEPTRRS